ncbi:MAG: hypothetical protein R3300_03655 [Candidatus Promineifilaceae bacterium]|nr:hypothetical protein [Candidatus Promineifilaceae bacterium]
MSKRTVLLTGLAVVLVLALAVTAAFAQEEGAAESVPESEEVAPERPVGKFGWRGLDDRPGDPLGGRGAGEEQLAEALGISVEELQAARLTVHAQRLEALVNEGLIDQDQADLLLALKSFKLSLDRQALLAEALGIGVDELETAREAGQTLGELLDAQGLTAAEFEEARRAAFEAAVEDAVADGVLTDAQAEEILSGAVAGPRGFGGPGHHRGHRAGPNRGLFGSGSDGAAAGPMFGAGA